MKKHDELQAMHQLGRDIKKGSIEQDLEHGSVIPIIKEQLRVDKKTVETGKVRISIQVTEHEEILTVPLVHEELQVKRMALNQFIDSRPPAIRYEGETMIIPIIKEVAVVEKRLMLVEELHLIKRQIQKQETQSVILREETVSIEHINSGLPSDGAEQSGS